MKTKASSQDWQKWLTAPVIPKKQPKPKGLMGVKALDPNYMPRVNQRARKLQAACHDKTPNKTVDPRQLKLPGFE